MEKLTLKQTKSLTQRYEYKRDICHSQGETVWVFFGKK